ncbi:MAG: ABC transporter ATP-binding protein [Anaerolineaceae bacterium]|nr:ABC transporter ATP-binding protein [Anaerolineaceae bacterium]
MNAISFILLVQEYALMGRKPYKKFLEGDNRTDWRVVDEVFHKIGLREYKHRKLSELSEGKKQRAMLARALSQDKPMILLNKTTDHLNVKYTLPMMKTFKSLGRIAFSAFHDINLAFLYCHCIIVLKEGKVVQEGPPLSIEEQLINELSEVEPKILIDETSGQRYMVFLK